jgi:hypothetical protein
MVCDGGLREEWDGGDDDRDVYADAVMGGDEVFGDDDDDE